MPALVIANVRENELPPGWASLLSEKADSYRVTIEPAGDDELSFSSRSLAMALRGMEEEAGPEYTAEDVKEAFGE